MKRYPAYFTRDFTIEAMRGDAHRRAMIAAMSRKYPGAKYMPSARAMPRTQPQKKDVWYIQRTAGQMIEGACSTNSLNSHGEHWLCEGMQLDDLPIPLLWNHDSQKQIGEVVWVKRLPAVIFCRATVDDRQVHIWREIRERALRSFSVGIDSLSQQSNVVDSWKLKEISVVESGANPECLFEIWTSPDRRPVRLNI